MSKDISGVLEIRGKSYTAKKKSMGQRYRICAGSAGMAAGLGNIWKFPGKVGAIGCASPDSLLYVGKKERVCLKKEVIYVETG